MEDKYKPSKEFTDQAWSEMKALLDNEMPDKGAIVLAPNEGKRKNYLLLLSLLLLLSMTALFFYYQTNRSLSSEESTLVEKSELAIISPNANTQAQEEISLKESEASQESNELSVLKSNLKSNTPDAPMVPAIEHSRVISKSNTGAFQTKEERKISIIEANNSSSYSQLPNKSTKIGITENIENKAKSELAKPFITNSEQYFEPLQDEKEESPKELREPIALLAPAAAKPLTALDFKEEGGNLEEFLELKKAKNRMPLYGIVGMRNYDFADNVNLAANLETVMRGKDKKLGVRTGFNYAQRNTTYLTTESTIARINSGTANEDNFEEFEMALDPGGSIANEAFYEARAALNANPIKYHFLEIPVLIDAKISKKWSVQAGLTGQGLLYSSTQNFGLLNGWSLRNEDALLAQNEERFNNVFTPQKFNLGATVGFNFAMTDRLGLQGRFSQNLRDIYPELNGKQRSNSINLGVSWRIR